MYSLGTGATAAPAPGVGRYSDRHPGIVSVDIETVCPSKRMNTHESETACVRTTTDREGDRGRERERERRQGKREVEQRREVLQNVRRMSDNDNDDDDDSGTFCASIIYLYMHGICTIRL